jgi:hypothetical protein
MLQSSGPGFVRSARTADLQRHQGQGAFSMGEHRHHEQDAKHEEKQHYRHIQPGSLYTEYKLVSIQSQPYNIL